MKKLSLVLLTVLLALVACDDKYPDLEDGMYAEIVTDKGTMLAQLYFDKTPATVASFVSLAEGTSKDVDSAFKGKPFYDGLTFHRIIKDFMIQGGDPDGTGAGGPGYKFFDELRPDLRHDTTGILSMANSGYGTNGSQFFITDAATPHLDGYDPAGTLKNCENPRVSCHTVFGKLLEGFDVLDTITNVEMTNPQMGSPKTPVKIEKINIIRKGSAAKKFDAPNVFDKELAAKAEEDRAAEAEKAEKLKVVKDRFDTQRAKAEELESGLAIYFDKKGDGPQPKTGQTVMVEYAGYFSNGELFDTCIESCADENGKQTRPEGQYVPIEVPYSPDAQLIAGFKEGIQQMKVGDKATLFIPYHLGYGERGYAIIPPKTDLVFEVEILNIK
ncbi:MAG: peptidylprolyl isomerase [Leeuwenhoekiella sp.]